MGRKFRHWLIVLLAFFCIGCSHWQAIAERAQLHQQVVQGNEFRHRLLWNAPAQRNLVAPPATPTLWHIFIEGDGHAVTFTGRPSRDPTPPAPLLLQALAADASPALYLGRPCYFATGDPACNPGHWTLQRYSAAVASSMTAAARTLLRPGDRAILIGHSGGGTLAMLLAARLPQTCAVITLAGNLDVTAWVNANDFTPLPDSLDPARQSPLPPSIAQWHFAGGRDSVIRASWIETFSQNQPGAHFVLLPDANHLQPWPRYLVNSLQALPLSPAERGSLPQLSPLLPALDNSQTVCGIVTG